LCNKSEKKKLIKTCKVDLNQSYPKEKDLVWRKRDVDKSRWAIIDRPEYKTDTNEWRKK
jgi:hypothetical protein